MSRTEEEHTDLGTLIPDRPASSVQSASPVTHHPSPVTREASLLLNLAALGVICWGMFQLDRPLLVFIRSLHILWVERVGDFFYLIGTGGGLITVSVLLLAAGYLLKQPQLQRSGLESLVAHGTVALIVQTMKHVIGRPRPRLMRDDEFFTGPSLGAGLDSFPSGHAAASFAVATVVAKHFPRWAWYVYGLAGLIAGSRVVRGSHFSSDVAVGAIAGTLVGSVVVGPLREWRASVIRAVSDLTPGLTIGFALLWTVCQPVVDPVQDAMMLWTGSIAVAFGAGSRWGSAFRGEPAAFLRYASPAIGLGLALATGSWIVVLIASLVISARWLVAGAPRADLPTGPGMQPLFGETAWAAALVIALFLLQSVKGALAPA